MTDTNSNQLSLQFDSRPDLNSFPIVLPDAEIEFIPNLYSEKESDEILGRLLNEVNWKQDNIEYYGKTIMLPRLTAWYGDEGSKYKYSGIGMDPELWTPLLLELKEKIEKVSEAHFNSVLLNLYRNGNDGVSWHRDDEKELGKNPIIASLSFGETRRFQFRHKYKSEIKKFEIKLTHGSLLIMKGATQTFWEHQIPKTSRPMSKRVNLTFRFIH